MFCTTRVSLINFPYVVQKVMYLHKCDVCVGFISTQPGCSLMSEQNIVQLMALYNDRSQGSMAKLEGDSADTDTQLTKLDVVLTFQLEVSQNKIPQK